MIWGILIFIILIAVYIWSVYNDLISSRLRIKEAWSQIDVQLKRRTDLIPNLVETVKGYAKHEKNLLENITKARAALVSAATPKEKATVDGELSKLLKSLFAVAENYPNLKANENFLQLQKELSDTEDKIAYSRQFYNSIVLEYNTKIAMFPAMFLARNMNFKGEEFYKVEEEAKKEVKVKFD